MSDQLIVERGGLEKKDKSELQAIVSALGGSASSRARKADLIDQILELGAREGISPSDGETVLNSDKLFSVFEPHTQLYKRGKAGEPIQFGRQVLVFEDAAGFIVKSVVMKRNQCDSGVAIEATKAVQTLFENKIERLSFDRGFHSPENHTELSKIIPHLCLPKPGSKQSVVQMANADDEFREAQQNHPGIESAIGSLQSGNGMERCRDRSELGFERYVSLAILGRNMHTLGRMLIAGEAADSMAASTRRKAA